MSLAGAVRWTLSSRIFTSMVSVGAPGMANSTINLRFSRSAYATVLGATLIRFSAILAPSFYPGFPFWVPGRFEVYTRSHLDTDDRHLKSRECSGCRSLTHRPSWPDRYRS